MTNQVIMRIFGSLQGLERCLRQVKQLLPENQEAIRDIAYLIPQQEQALKKMRRLANTLQLQIAKKDWKNAVRTMQIFYGLNHMIRSDLLGAFAKLSGAEKVPLAADTAVVPKVSTYH